MFSLADCSSLKWHVVSMNQKLTMLDSITLAVVEESASVLYIIIFVIGWSFG